MKFAVIPLSLMLCVSCATTVRPPAEVADPSTVVILSHGISSSLILADEGGRAVRFAYGDWHYYALGRTGIRETLAALLWPTSAALGRQVVEGAKRQDDLVAQFGIEYDGKLFVAAERDAVQALRQRLEAQFLANIESRAYNPEVKLEFVPHPQPYSLCRNSNQMVAQWLTELGATVEGLPILPKWRMKPAHTVH